MDSGSLAFGGLGEEKWEGKKRIKRRKLERE